MVIAYSTKELIPLYSKLRCLQLLIVLATQVVKAVNILRRIHWKLCGHLFSSKSLLKSGISFFHKVIPSPWLFSVTTQCVVLAGGKGLFPSLARCLIPLLNYFF